MLENVDILHQNHCMHIIEHPFNVVGVRSSGKVEETFSLNFIAIGKTILGGSAPSVVSTFFSDFQKFITHKTLSPCILVI